MLAAGGATICIATHSGAITAYSVSTGHKRWSVNTGVPRALAASARGRCIAVGLASGSIELLDVDTGVRTASIEGHEGPVTALAFCSNGRRLTSLGRDGALRLWDTATAHLVATLRSDAGSAASLTSLADGRIAIAWDDGRIELLAVTGCET